MYPVGITTCYGLPLSEETLFQLKAAGLDAIELSLKLDAEQDLSAIRKMADAANVRIWSCHLPFRPHKDQRVRRTSGSERTMPVHGLIISNSTDWKNLLYLFL